MSEEKLSPNIIYGWEEVKPLIEQIEPDFEGKSGIIDAEPYLQLKNDTKRLDYYFNHTILSYCTDTDKNKIYDALVNIRNICINRNSKIKQIRIELTSELVGQVQEEVNKIFEIFKNNPFSALFEDIFSKLNSSFEQDRQRFQQQVDEFLGENHYKKLSSAFSQQVKLVSASRKVNLKKFNCLVYWIIGIILASYIFPSLSNISICNFKPFVIFDFFNQGDDLTSFIKGMIIRITFISPLIWLAYFRLKNVNEDKMLEHEYRHKEVMAKSYIHYVNEIDRLVWNERSMEEKERLKTSLLNTSIQVLGKDPTSLLNKNRTDEFPLEKIIMELIKKIPDKQ